ncbi:MAG: hypothetical protein JNL41_19980 [Phenylobacterium sp.]|uniref:hypothetical protein n=1 Tax=Phenylobacterium sp. TaxID=1871053 RepID=UPI001A5A43F9|nr:hypothetical protein [Phenylobacterium sp.]MBL8556563.1 hypothetical protein [Phenylobacterium sp.]
MKPSLDDLIEALRASPPDADLSQIGPGAWRRIARVRRARSVDAWLLPARAGAVVFALTAGAALGAAHAREAAPRPEVAAFQVASVFAPSTLLDRH